MRISSSSVQPMPSLSLLPPRWPSQFSCSRIMQSEPGSHQLASLALQRQTQHKRFTLVAPRMAKCSVLRSETREVG